MQQIKTYRWPVDSIPLAVLSVRVDDLAARMEMTVNSWKVEGLGDARGMGCVSSSGYVYLLEELQRSERLGLDVYVDATLLANLGADVIVSEMLAEFGLDRVALTWLANSETEAFAAQQVAKLRIGLQRNRLDRLEVSFQVLRLEYQAAAHVKLKARIFTVAATRHDVTPVWSHRAIEITASTATHTTPRKCQKPAQTETPQWYS